MGYHSSRCPSSLFLYNGIYSHWLDFIDVSRLDLQPLYHQGAWFPWSIPNEIHSLMWKRRLACWGESRDVLIWVWQLGMQEIRGLWLYYLEAKNGDYGSNAHQGEIFLIKVSAGKGNTDGFWSWSEGVMTLERLQRPEERRSRPVIWGRHCWHEERKKKGYLCRR